MNQPDILAPSSAPAEDGAQTITVEQAFTRYEAIRSRLPDAASGGAAIRANRLLDTVEHYDGYIFDSFGVLNVGDTAIDGAAECLAALRDLNKPFCVLTNAASYTSEAALTRYRHMGLDIRPGEVVSSRDVALAHLATAAPGTVWSAISAPGDGYEDAPAGTLDLLAGDDDWAEVSGFLFLSSSRWSESLQNRLVAELLRRARPVAIANPDLVAPREGGLTLEPGWWAHDLQDRTGIEPLFFGKPFASAFRAAADRLGGGRLAMVGDTLHTDILGGRAAGLGTILVTRHGLLAGEDAHDFMQRSSIFADFVMPAI